jgi:hypothetical protein
MVDGCGVTVGAQLAAAQVPKHSLAESTLRQVSVRAVNVDAPAPCGVCLRIAA